MSYDGIDSVVGKRGLFVCRIACITLLQRLKGRMFCDVRDFKNIETLAVKFYFLAKQDEEGNSHHSDRNIRIICTIVCHRQIMGAPV